MSRYHRFSYHLFIRVFGFYSGQFSSPLIKRRNKRNGHGKFKRPYHDRVALKIASGMEALTAGLEGRKPFYTVYLKMGLFDQGRDRASDIKPSGWIHRLLASDAMILYGCP
ncbi:MAG: hypothetical protein QXE79_06020 [Candidatus Bathyarchaeia archaeon]